MKIYEDGQVVSMEDVVRIIAKVGGDCIVGYSGYIPETLRSDQVLSELADTGAIISIHSNYGNGLTFREGDVTKEHSYITLLGKDFSSNGVEYILEI